MSFIVIVFLFIHFLFLTPIYAANSVDLPIEEDTYIEEKYPTISPWNNRNLFLGTDAWYGKGKTRILIKPDFSMLLEDDILPSDIEKVELLLTQYEYEGTDTGAIIDTYTTTTPWSMFTVTWNLQPSISTKKDSSAITTQSGQKTLNVTNAFIEAYKSYPSIDKGILLKINAETEKALIFWAHGCDISPTPPICSGMQDRPRFRVTIKANNSPSLCTLKSPSNDLMTNNPSVIIEPNPSTDPEGNSITYIGRICTDISCSSILWQSNIAPGVKNSSDLNDGEFLLSCSANDGHLNQQWGIPIQITIDTKPPATPILIDEPPFTGTRDNIVSWYPNIEESAEYQVLSSERSDFRSYNAYSPWIRENRYTVFHTKEKTFYYRIKARDKAGNESSWSNSTSTIIDATFPIVKYFKTNKQLLSPKVNSKGDVTENAYIQGGADDATTEAITLEILNQEQKIVYSETIEDKSYLWTHWPEKAGYIDGIYLARLLVKDSVQQYAQSEPLLITLDTTAPQQPIINGIKDKQLLNNPIISFTVSCVDHSKVTIYLGGKIISTGKEKDSVTVNQKDGTHTLSAKCTDEVGNESTRSLSFTVDTIPPSPPPISYVLQEENMKLQMKIYCREDGSGELFLHGALIYSETCSRNSYVATILSEAIKAPYYALFTARLTDKAGNKSQLMEKTVYLETASSIPKQQVCSVSIEENLYSISTVFCNWSEDSLNYKTTNAQGKDMYKSTFTIRSNSLAKIQVTFFNCKAKSIWDPRTWFSCVREKVNEQLIDGKLTALFSSENDLKAISNSQLEVNHKKTETLSIQSYYLLQFSVKIGDTFLNSDTLSPKQKLTFSPTYPSNTQKAYFSWLFAIPKEVSQWHGNTAYQKPHGGIDFSVTKETIFAPAKGTVISVGYSKQSICNSGGYYLGILHPNGFYTYYFHLASTAYLDGRAIKKGDSVSAGQKLTKTGNSGLYNCEPLAAHLHFELRKNALSSSHTNPVPYFNIDWNTIHTSRVSQFPGRLSGDNPHPKF